MNNFEEDLVPINDKRLVFFSKKDPDIIIKKFLTSDSAAEAKFNQEVSLQKLAGTFVSTPKVFNTVSIGDYTYLVMQKIKGKTLYDIYGDNPKNMPTRIWNDIHNIVNTLFQHNIHYVDITPFNFIITEDEDIFVIDFGHAYYSHVDWFLKDFLDGSISWNPDYA